MIKTLSQSVYEVTDISRGRFEKILDNKKTREKEERKREVGGINTEAFIHNNELTSLLFENYDDVSSHKIFQRKSRKKKSILEENLIHSLGLQVLLEDKATWGSADPEGGEMTAKDISETHADVIKLIKSSDTSKFQNYVSDEYQAFTDFLDDSAKGTAEAREQFYELQEKYPEVFQRWQLINNANQTAYEAQTIGANGKILLTDYSDVVYSNGMPIDQTEITPYESFRNLEYRAQYIWAKEQGMPLETSGDRVTFAKWWQENMPDNSAAYTRDDVSAEIKQLSQDLLSASGSSYDDINIADGMSLEHNTLTSKIIDFYNDLDNTGYAEKLASQLPSEVEQAEFVQRVLSGEIDPGSVTDEFLKLCPEGIEEFIEKNSEDISFNLNPDSDSILSSGSEAAETAQGAAEATEAAEATKTVQSVVKAEVESVTGEKIEVSTEEAAEIQAATSSSEKIEKIKALGGDEVEITQSQAEEIGTSIENMSMPETAPDPETLMSVAPSSDPLSVEEVQNIVGGSLLPNNTNQDVILGMFRHDGKTTIVYQSNGSRGFTEMTVDGNNKVTSFRAVGGEDGATHLAKTLKGAESVDITTDEAKAELMQAKFILREPPGEEMRIVTYEPKVSVPNTAKTYNLDDMPVDQGVPIPKTSPGTQTLEFDTDTSSAPAESEDPFDKFQDRDIWSPKGGAEAKAAALEKVQGFNPRVLSPTDARQYSKITCNPENEGLTLDTDEGGMCIGTEPADGDPAIVKIFRGGGGVEPLPPEIDPGGGIEPPPGGGTGPQPFEDTLDTIFKGKDGTEIPYRAGEGPIKRFDGVEDQLRKDVFSPKDGPEVPYRFGKGVRGGGTYGETGELDLKLLSNKLVFYGLGSRVLKGFLTSSIEERTVVPLIRGIDWARVVKASLCGSIASYFVKNKAQLLERGVKVVGDLPPEIRALERETAEDFGADPKTSGAIGILSKFAAKRLSKDKGGKEITAEDVEKYLEDDMRRMIYTYHKAFETDTFLRIVRNKDANLEKRKAKEARGNVQRKTAVGLAGMGIGFAGTALTMSGVGAAIGIPLMAMSGALYSNRTATYTEDLMINGDENEVELQRQISKVTADDTKKLVQVIVDIAREAKGIEESMRKRENLLHENSLISLLFEADLDFKDTDSVGFPVNKVIAALEAKSLFCYDGNIRPGTSEFEAAESYIISKVSRAIENLCDVKIKGLEKYNKPQNVQMAARASVDNSAQVGEPAIPSVARATQGVGAPSLNQPMNGPQFMNTMNMSGGPFMQMFYGMMMYNMMKQSGGNQSDFMQFMKGLNGGNMTSEEVAASFAKVVDSAPEDARTIMTSDNKTRTLSGDDFAKAFKEATVFASDSKPAISARDLKLIHVRIKKSIKTLLVENSKMLGVFEFNSSGGESILQPNEFARIAGNNYFKLSKGATKAKPKAIKNAIKKMLIGNSAQSIIKFSDAALNELESVKSETDDTKKEKLKTLVSQNFFNLVLNAYCDSLVNSVLKLKKDLSVQKIPDMTGTLPNDGSIVNIKALRSLQTSLSDSDKDKFKVIKNEVDSRFKKENFAKLKLEALRQNKNIIAEKTSKEKYLLGNLSNLLFEEKTINNKPRVKSIEDINLRQEWLKIWDI